MNIKGKNPLANGPAYSGIKIDESGDWFYNGNRIFRTEILEELYARLDRLPSGEFILSDSNGPCLIEVADTPFVISRVDLETDQSGTERVLLRFKNLSWTEVLDPCTLVSGKSNVLYCRVAKGRFPARFSRPAYYQLAELVQEDDTGQGFYVSLNGNRHPIATSE